MIRTVTQAYTNHYQKGDHAPDAYSLLECLVEVCQSIFSYRGPTSIPDTDYNLNPDGYRPRGNAMKNTVNRLAPTLATGDRWREVKYTPLRNRDPQLESTALGRVRFKYDPDHNGRRKATLWFEREATPYHDDEW